MNVKEYASIFKEALSETGYIEVAIRIMEQIGLDNRTQFISNSKKVEVKSDIELATPKQIVVLKKHNLYREGLTKQEAKQIIAESMNKEY